ncbi:MAG: asparagine synthetase B family protein [Capsulimonadaceae bacterium]
MSAIAGIFHRTGAPVRREDLERMDAALAAHGPDRGAIGVDGAVALLHRRMCFVPEDRIDEQPVAADNGAWMVSAGRIDNRAELWRTLGLAPAAPDSRFILEAFTHWGREFPERLIGDYTAAVAEPGGRSLVLAVAPLSSHPLFYTVDADRLAFATTPGALFVLKGVERALDEEYAVRYLLRAPNPPESTFFRGIRQIPPGNCLQVNERRVSVEEFWQPDLDRVLSFSSEDECHAAFHEVLDRVVEDHLRSLTPVGIMLSGGLDSSTVAATAAPRLGRRGERLTAYTSVPRGRVDLGSSARYADETPYVRQIAAMYPNIDLSLVSPNNHFLENVDALFDAAEFPFRNACNLPWFEAILAAASADNARVVLCGIGGNITMSWNGLDTPGRRGLNTAMREARANRTPVWRTVVREGILPWIPGSEAVLSARRQRTGQVVPRPTARRYRLAGYTLAEPPVVTGVQGRARRLAILRTSARLAGSLRAGFRARFGVEMRDPTVDVRIVEFCLALPEDIFRRDGVTRRLVRHGMAGRLPVDILNMRGRGLQAADWRDSLMSSTGPRADIVERLDRLATNLVVAGLIDIPKVRRGLERLPRAKASDILLRNLLESGLMTGCFIDWFLRGAEEEERI